MSMSMPGRRVAGPFWAQAVNQNHIFSKIPTRTEMRGIMWLGSSLSLEEALLSNPGNRSEGPGWTGGTCPGTISLAHILRGSCARASFG